MADNPEVRWFWNDWDNDLGLRVCSFAAQGLWMRMLSIAARSEPRGYVAVNGTPLGAREIAMLVGHSTEEVANLLAELDQNHVFSRDRKGRIYNRRMIRDEKRRKTAKKNGSKGGNPKLLSGIDQATDTTTEYALGITETEPTDQPNCQPPCVRARPLVPFTQEESFSLRSKDARAKSGSIPPTFEAWWAVWPNKVGKGAAVKAYRSALSRASPAEMIIAVPRYVANKPPEREWCNPATWLNQDRWLDEPAQVIRMNGHDPSGSVASVSESRIPKAPPSEALLHGVRLLE